MMMSMIMTNSTISNFRAEPDHVHIFSVKEHDYYKPLLLKCIQQMITDNNIEPNSKGYLYDFDIAEARRPYKKLMDQMLYPYIEDVGEMYGVSHLKTSTYWFQQYFQNTDFGWHTHQAHWACVYYLELPEMTEATEFLNYGQFNVKEGDVIFFPTFLVHRSPIIKSNQRKTVIATNITYEVDREMIEQYGEQSFKH